MDSLEIIELLSTALLIAYVILIAFRKVVAWPIGIVGSALAIYVFYKSHYQAEAFLYVYYVIAGFVGWSSWKNTVKNKFEVSEWKLPTHFLTIILGVAAAYGLSFLIEVIFPSNPRPLIDSFTTVFAFIATFMQIKKIYSNWIYWVVINGLTIYLYFYRGLNFYGCLAIVYTGLSVFGLFSWLSYRTND